MRKTYFAAFFGLMVSLTSVAADCDYPLHQKVFDGAFSWTNGGLKAVALFEPISTNLYRVKGVYELESDGKYRKFRNYLVEWPTFYGNGETGRVKKVRFRKGQYGCLIEFIGQKSTNPSTEEIYKAHYEVEQTGLQIRWMEKEDLLRFSSVPRRDIEE